MKNVGVVCMEILNVKEIEEFLNKIISVLNNRVVLSDKGEMVEIHILANSQRSVKQIIRDVQTVLTTKFNLKIDHKIISIAQVYEKDEDYNLHRLTIEEVEYSTSQRTAKARVQLGYNGNTYTGESDGVQSSTQSNKLVARATLKAIESFLNNTMNLILEEIKTIKIAEKNVVISCVNLIDKQSEKCLIGNCVVDNDVNLAITKSILDALNRVIEVK